MVTTRKPTNIATVFCAELLRRMRNEDRYTPTSTLASTIVAHLHQDGARIDESAQYFGLCERAWLHWSRPALDYIVRRALNQDTAGPPTPPHIRDAHDATQAHTRCATHVQLLDHASKHLNHADWPWHLEAARNVHESTRHALGYASKLENGAPADATALHTGLMHAADAFAVTVDAGFVEDGEQELRETLGVMRR